MRGFLALQDYVATHVLTCLIRRFCGRGHGGVHQPEGHPRSPGENANKMKSFSLASVSSFLIAACSCTVIPVASGLFYGGAGVGVAFIILWVAPSANILSLIYTGNILGPEIVAARVVASLLMAFVVGWVMTIFFGKEKRETVAAFKGDDEPRGIIARPHLILMVLILLSLLLPNYIGQTGPYLTKVMIWGVATLVLAAYAWKALSREEIASWLRESWWFIRIIFPLLLGGVFLVGVIGRLLPEEWIRAWLGGDGITASFLATMIGAVSYFATMTEAPFVDTLMKLGMGKGPALTLLLTGPGLSLPNWIAIARIFGHEEGRGLRHHHRHPGDALGWFFGIHSLRRYDERRDIVQIRIEGALVGIGGLTAIMKEWPAAGQAEPMTRSGNSFSAVREGNYIPRKAWDAYGKALHREFRKFRGEAVEEEALPGMHVRILDPAAPGAGNWSGTSGTSWPS